MKKIELFWNWLYFCFFEFNIKTQIVINKFVASLMAHIVPKSKRYTRIPPLPFYLTQISISDVTILAFTALLEWTLFNSTSILFPSVSLVHLDKISFCLISGIPCYLINYLFLWRKDKYLKYFERFAKASSKRKRIWLLISLLLLPLALLIFILSMMIMKHEL